MEEKTTTTLSVKLVHGTEIRRFGMELQNSGIGNYNRLLAKICTIVSNIRFDKIGWKDEDDGRSGCIACLDSDGDMIVFTTDEEMKEAVKTTNEDCLRIFTIVDPSLHPEKPTPPSRELPLQTSTPILPLAYPTPHKKQQPHPPLVKKEILWPESEMSMDYNQSFTVKPEPTQHENQLYPLPHNPPSNYSDQRRSLKVHDFGEWKRLWFDKTNSGSQCYPNEKSRKPTKQNQHRKESSQILPKQKLNSTVPSNLIRKRKSDEKSAPKRKTSMPEENHLSSVSEKPTEMVPKKAIKPQAISSNEKNKKKKSKLTDAELMIMGSDRSTKKDNEVDKSAPKKSQEKDVMPGGYKCRICNETVEVEVGHIYQRHLMKPRFECPYERCFFYSQYLAGPLKIHIHNKHSHQTPQPIIDNRKLYQSEYSEWKMKCFGQPMEKTKRKVSKGRMSQEKCEIRCRLCSQELKYRDRGVRNIVMKTHIYIHHIRQPTIRCPYKGCQHTDVFMVGNVKVHMRTKHPDQPVELPIDERHRYSKQYFHFLEECFGLGGSGKKHVDGDNGHSNKNSLQNERVEVGKPTTDTNLSNNSGAFPAVKVEENAEPDNPSEQNLVQHSCDLCPYTSSVRGNLTRHSIRHTTRKNFNCLECKKTYLDKSSLDRHKICHTRQAVKCSECSKNYQRQDLLDKHMKSAHKNC